MVERKGPEPLKLIFFQFFKIGKVCPKNKRLVNIISVTGKMLEGIMGGFSSIRIGNMISKCNKSIIYSYIFFSFIEI